MVEQDRGQLILIGALLVAASIIASITLLNAIHESPEVKTQQDAQSLAETERTAVAVRHSLEQLFLHNVSVDRTGEQLPYANNSFAGIVEAYNRQRMNLSTSSSAGILNVSYLGGSQFGGIVVKQNKTDSGYREFPTDPSNQTLVENGKTVPRVGVVVNETGTDFSINVTSSSGDVGLSFDTDNKTKRSSTLTAGTEVVCSPPSSFNPAGDGQIELTFAKGIGSVTYVTGTGVNRTAVQYCGDIRFGDELTGPYDVEIGDSTDAEGTFVVTATKLSPATPPSTDSSLDADSNRVTRGISSSDIIVNPRFEVEYQTPNIYYNSTFALYNRTGQ